MSRFRLNLLFAWQSLIYAVGLLLGTGIISGWGRWYSPGPHYRRQVEALLRGELALSHNPAETIHDLTWSCGGVHQVWGLGVPLWRLPFEAAARLVGLPAFPDHFAFGLALALTAFLVLHTFISPVPPGAPEGRGIPRGRGLLASALLLLCPVFLSLCGTRFEVYEEAVAYEYLFATGLLAGLVRLWRAPAWPRCWGLCLVAGFGPLIRPTVLFYGVATVLGAMLVMLPVPAGSRWTKWRNTLIASGLFGVGGLVLFATNAARFGSGFEFGHKLNVQTLYGSLYVTRFDDPFRHEPVTSAARELFGLLFQVRDLSGSEYYMADFFPGQSPTVRWREMYFTTFDLTWLPLILLGWGGGLVALFRGGRKPGSPRRSPGSGDPERDGEPRRLLILVTLWSLLPMAVLCAFYLRNCVVSARYMTDLAPACSAALVALVLAWPVRDPVSGAGRAVSTAAALALMGWLSWQILTSRNSYGPPHPATESEVRARLAHIPPAPEPIGDHYSVTEAGGEVSSVPPAASRFAHPWGSIPYNGVGWDHRQGLTQPVVIIFVRDADFIELDLRAASGSPLTEADWQWVRVKLGLETLRLESTTRLPDGTRRLRFTGPKKAGYRHGVQAAYVALGPPEQLVPHITPYRLLQVRWR